MHASRLLAFLALPFSLALVHSQQPSPVPPLAVLKGHTEAVEAVAFSPDGTLIATACFDRNLRLFDATTGTLARIYGGEQGHKGQVLAVAFNARGDQIATGSADNSARVWDVPVPFPVQTIATSAPATRLLISGTDGKTFAVATADGLVKIYPGGEDKGVIELKGHKGAVTQLELAGGVWVTAGADKTIRFWDATGKQTAVRFIPGTLVGLAANSNSPTVWLGTTDGSVQAWAVQQQPVVPSAVAAVGSLPAFAFLDGAVKKGRPVPGLPTREWQAGKFTGLALSPDNQRIVTIGPGKDCTNWLAANGNKERTFEAGGNATAAAFNKDGQRLAVSGSDGSVKLYTVGDGKLVGSFAAGGPVAELSFHPTAPQIAGTLKNAATVWTVAHQSGQPLPPEFGRPIQTYPHPKGLNSPSFNKDGHFLTAGEDNQVRRFRIASDVAVKNLPHPNLVDCVAFDDTGNLLATGCHDGNLRIWDLPKNQPLKTIAAHVVTTPQNIQNPIYAVQWTRDHKQVFTSSYDKTIKLWDLASGNLVREFKADPGPIPVAEVKKDEKKDEKKEPPKKEEPKAGEAVGHRDQVFSIALTKDGKFLASGSSDKTVKLWDVATGKVIRDFPNPDLKPGLPGELAPSHPGWVHSVRFVPGDQLLVSVGAAPRGRSYLAVWNVSNGQRVFGKDLDLGPIHSIGVSNDGTKLLLGAAPPRRANPTARFW
ncbi:MAG: WD40 repeat domain-containing protein [Gemmataceae bacterium]